MINIIKLLIFFLFNNLSDKRYPITTSFDTTNMSLTEDLINSMNSKVLFGLSASLLVSLH